MTLLDTMLLTSLLQEQASNEAINKIIRDTKEKPDADWYGLNFTDPEPDCATNDTDSCDICGGGNAADLGCGCFEPAPQEYWFDDDEEVIVQNKPASSSGLKYVTVNIKEKIAVKIADPLGARQTGVGCALWKSNSGETGKCCWNSKGQCYCPCPE